ncbi:actin-related protein 5 [Dorcoceras hygrometricum]|uniref:Actin-related protein 5 n=1 Tax=Dorcoceras hygrometricum TaxID=472368 RepID=A0A2Z7D9U4_9LAMI|nr:actin-related protein 5 [Dorcoceras hygrometricum]
MQHAINQCYECMRDIKDRIARPASRLAIISIEPLYHAHQVSRWKSSVRDLQGPSAHHSSMVFRYDKSFGHHSDDSVGHFRHNKSVGQSQSGSQSGYKSICQAQYVLATRQISIQREMLTPKLKPAGEQRNRLLQKASNTSSYTLPLLNNSTQVLATRQISIQREMLTPKLKPAGEQRNRLLQKASNTSSYTLPLQR